CSTCRHPRISQPDLSEFIPLPATQQKGVGDMKEFVVRLQKGSVESFGERVNFGSSLFGTNAPAGATAK
ncbi:MAG: hypothetical protein ACKPAH_09495, partial [Verrucomicrobiota bacterium]